MLTVDLAWMQSIHDLKEVPADQLSWLVDNSRHYIQNEGECMIRPGEPIGGMHIIVQGKLRLYIMQDNFKRELATLSERDITGYLPYSRGKIANAYGEVLEDTQLMTFPVERFPELIKEHFELTQALVHVMSNRVREFTALQQQNEKMMALGKLSAGLAHELNNPASAIVRASNLLKKQLRLQPDTFRTVMALQMTPKQVDHVSQELFRILRERKPERLSLRERSNREDRLTDWFDEHEVENGAEMAENFVEYGFAAEDLNLIHSDISTSFLTPVFSWVNNNLIIERIVEDIENASGRIADLVCSVKVFTHMDRGGDKQLTDIHTGIQNTLTMLGYKIKKGNIKLVEEYDESLPQLTVRVGELNQVWTNIIDNALDAMEPNGKGTLTIRTAKEHNDVLVTFIDDGPGIPQGILSRIFDPFFTTKEIGKGTGMGLEVVQRIIHQHHGSIRVNSVQGQTRFTVCLPVADK
ncbi:MAG: cyclic nucleotide-binding domain-containing protein [Williamsia sp.]|nr:cyclic nucleotide-binding domain-containing protein [Williamsia sp.]